MSNENNLNNFYENQNISESKPVRYCIDNHYIDGDYNDFIHFNYNQLKTLLNLKMIDDYPCYFIEYKGGYYFEDFLKVGASSLEEQFNFLDKKNLYPPEYIKNKNIYTSGCTCFYGKNEEGEYLYGFNHDWEDTSGLLLYTNPPCAYASLSMVAIPNLGYYGKMLPSCLWDRRHLLTTPYFPNDGVNECGVAMALLKVPYSRSPEDPSKVSILFTSAIRLVLDYAKNLNEAIELLKQFNIKPITLANGKLVQVHYLISDALGDSAIIEFVDGEMKVIRDTEIWQAVTNFNIYKYKHGEGVEGTGIDRYQLACDILRSKNGIVTINEALNILNSVKGPTANDFKASIASNNKIHQTCWSCVYNLSEINLNLVLGTKFGKVIKMNILQNS
ncbi:linear amide C-N hydrolase [Clostridium aestuarii]|uniref:Linear amide C-N hydrolase n=1 Tax=Clostridium aestuarii TaxID=338193 RepID=A0ABT4CVL9_9CLOT|nr:linear amide C-N hydrolase [Clostridium aestuarii]MCY6483029.1 linear amide C-N hydrolase [Clostridium aestuarii]